MERNVGVRYFSKTGNTKKLAERIAETAGCKAETVDIPIKEKLDILFLGGSVYYAGIDKNLKNFIQNLDKEKIKEVVVFSTSALTEKAFPEIKKCLMEKGIRLSGENFYCRGKFTALHRGRPNENDLKEAAVFAKKFL